MIGIALTALGALVFMAAPALAAAPETPELRVEGIRASEATFQGTLNPHAEAEVEGGSYHFTYKAGASCAGGTETTPGVALGQPGEALPGEPVSGLTANTEYTVCLVEETGGGTATATASFMTAPEAPETSSPAKSITAVSAELEGTLNPHATAKDGWYFAYSNPGGALCAEGPATATEPEALVKAKKEKTTVTGLEAHSTYVFCLVARNSAGETTAGNKVSFLTKSLAASVTGESSNSVKATEARVEATVNAENEATECHFQYGTASVTENEAECEQGTLNGGEQGVAVTFTGLQEGTAYKWRVIVKNPTGQNSGSQEAFTTAITPEISGEEATAITGTGATMSGVLNETKPGEAGTYEFLYSKGAGCEEAGGHTTPQAQSTGASPEPVSAPTGELLPGTEYTFCLRAKNPAGETITGTPVSFTTTAVGLENSPTVTATEATVTAEIGTDNAETNYEVQYGTTSITEHTTPTPEATIPASTSPTPVQQVLTGLEPSATYKYRFTANNGHELTTGETRTLTTPAATSTEPPEKCPNAARRAEQPYAKTLPDCRAYEMVSPTNTNGNDATETTPLLYPGTVRAALSGEPGGEAITYGSRGSYAEPTGSLIWNQILSRREPEHDRWGTRSITPPYDTYNGTTFGSYVGTFFTPELTEGLTATTARLTSEAPEGLAELYRLGLSEGSESPGPYTLVSHLPPSEEQYETLFHTGSSTGVFPLGASTDLSHVVFTAGHVPFHHVWEWVNGAVSPVAVSNNDEVWEATVGDSSPLVLFVGYYWHAVSDAGSRVIFEHAGELYVRVNPEQEQSHMSGEECLEPTKACTVKLSAGAAEYRGANGEDTRIFYTENEDLYEYTLEPGNVIGHSTALTHQGKVQSVAQISEDGTYVYYVANAKLAAGATEGRPNLYVSHDAGAPSFIATISTNDLAGLGHGPGGDEAALSPGGTLLAFTSVASLTDYDNRQAAPGDCEHELPLGGQEEGHCSEVYLYNTETSAISCASCNPTGSRPVGPARLAVGAYLKGGGSSNYEPRDLLETGELFFDSSDALVQHASSGVQNVFEYEHGRIYAVSGVSGSYESFFLDASADGKDVFFATADQLLPQDTSNNVVVYDARENGGFPLGTVTSPCTTAEECRNASPPTPFVFAPPPSATFSGPGNLAPVPAPAGVKPKPKVVKCKRGFVKKKVKKREECVKKKSKKRAKKSSKSKRGGKS